MKKSVIILIVVVIILSIGAIILSNVTKNNKTLTEYDYILEKETEFSDDEYTGKLPIINLNSSDVQKINNIIMSKYYRCAYGSDVFYYDYYANICNSSSLTKLLIFQARPYCNNE